ncbi:MAG: hypothetical protein ACM336_04685 [Acidobacteriota bacterium]
MLTDAMSHDAQAVRWFAERVRQRFAKKNEVPDVAVLKRIINAASRACAAEAVRIDEFLKRSGPLFSPLGDPLQSLGFQKHRWLGPHREEAYSDWLEWIFAQLQPRQTLAALGITDAETLEACTDAQCTAQRELVVPEGHEGSGGRLDLVIRFGGRVLIVVEVKRNGAEGSDLGKQKGYQKWIDRQPERWKHNILLVTEATGEEYDGEFRPRTWADLCIELRRAAISFCKKSPPMIAAMILAFVGAVEQCLLGFAANAAGGQAIEFQSPRIADYLSEFIQGVSP